MTHYTVTRDELYERVWSRPMTKVAKDFGLSDRGLAKLCERNSIPVPPRGYWAEKETGKTLQKPPLVKIDNESQRFIPIRRNACESIPNKYEHEFQALLEDLKGKVRHEADLTNKIQVDETLSDPFPAVSMWTRRDYDSGKDKKVSPSKPLHPKNRPNTFQIETKHRRRVILNSLLKALKQRGLLVTVKNETDWITVSDKFDVINFNIEESSRQYRRDLTEDEKKWNFLTSDKSWKYDTQPTGNLKLRIRSEYSFESVIRETTRLRLEQRLNEVMVFIFKMFYKVAAHRLKLEKYEKDLQAEHAEKQQSRANALLETKRRESLEIKMTNWHKAKSIRECVAAIEKAELTSSRNAYAVDFATWKMWALKYADELDEYKA